MVKGFVFFRDGKIPFVIEDYCMELFTDDNLLKDFTKEHNFKNNYILQGQYFGDGFQAQKAIFLVERSIGNTCYLRCYIINMLTVEGDYDTIGFQSPSLDDVFRYSYNYLDMVRAGINLAVEPKNVYKTQFDMNDRQYELTYRIGHDNRLGLLEDFDRTGELLVPLKTIEIQECYDISMVLCRLAMFMTSQAEATFKRITLYKDGRPSGWFYCPLVLKEGISVRDMTFYEFDVMRYIPKILNNIALDLGDKIRKSISLGHLGNFDSLFSPQRFMQQVVAFKYLFDKLDHKKAQDPRVPLKNERECMFNAFPKLLSDVNLSSDRVSEQIKELRRNIVHGYAYYYDFKNDSKTQRLILLLDKLIRNMSLLYIGFSKDDIAEFPIY